MPIIQYCPFCENLGFKSPHDHTIRDFKKHDNPIICPRLLQCECKYCHKIGHTKNYCPQIKKKRAREKNNDNESSKHNTNKKFKKDNILASYIASLSVSIDSDSEEISHINKKSSKRKFDSIY